MSEFCLIISGAPECYFPVSFTKADFVIACDAGYIHAQRADIVPDVIIGDFDSYLGDLPGGVEIIRTKPEKDDTDTMYAVKEMVKRGCDEFLLLGVIGARLDHTLGNVAILLYLDSLGKRASILDDYSEMEIVSRKPAQIDERYEFFSLLNISGIAKGIDIENAKYPLRDAEISCEYPYGVSNEVLPGKTACVTVRCGRLLLIKVRPQAG